MWIPNDSDCCVTFCQSKANTTQWWCRERFQYEASREFPRLGVLCGTDFDRDVKTHWCVPEEDADEAEEAEEKEKEKNKDGGDSDDDDKPKETKRSVPLF